MPTFEVYDLLVKHDKLCITGETTEVETLCLCGNKGATKDTVKTVPPWTSPTLAPTR